MKIIMLGAPGSGKGTQSKLISDYYAITHLSTGEIFRDNIKRKTELGLLSREYIDKGFLVPDKVTIAMLADRLTDDGGGFILDGFPRTLNQAFALSAMCRIDAVINLEISDELAAKRLSGRWTCVCGVIYHESALHSPYCNACGQPLTQRSDDTHDAIMNRLVVYHNQTEPLLNYYAALKLLKTVAASKGVSDIFEELKSVLSLAGSHDGGASSPTARP